MQIGTAEDFPNSLHTTATGAAPDGVNSGNADGIRQVTAIAMLADEAGEIPCAIGEHRHDDLVMPHGERVPLSGFGTHVWRTFRCDVVVDHAYGQKQQSQEDRSGPGKDQIDGS